MNLPVRGWSCPQSLADSRGGLYDEPVGLHHVPVRLGLWQHPAELLDLHLSLRLPEALDELEAEDAVDEVLEEDHLLLVVRPLEHQDEMDAAELVDGVHPEEHQVVDLLGGVLVHEVRDVEYAPAVLL